MKVTRATKIPYPMDWVFSMLDQKMFNALKPPSFLANIELYEGNNLNDRVSIWFKIFKQRMMVKIIDIHSDNAKCYFVDEGLELPFGLTKWQHKHLVTKGDNNRCILQDEIFFTHKTPLGNWFSFIILQLFLLQRSFQYRSYLKKHGETKNKL